MLKQKWIQGSLRNHQWRKSLPNDEPNSIRVLSPCEHPWNKITEHNLMKNTINRTELKEEHN